MQIDIREMGKRIREARERAGLTQSELGDELGISGNAVTKIENGHNILTLPHLVKLPKILHRPISFFLNLEVDSGLKPDEEELLWLYRSLPPGQSRDHLFVFLRSWVEQQKKQQG